MHPNLFTYATSELSQDAVLAWMLAWADGTQGNKDHPLHRLGVRFLEAMFEKAREAADAAGARVLPQVPESIEAVVVKPQEAVKARPGIKEKGGRIDLLCTVNGEYAVLIEDKVGTQQHSNQLERYRAHALQKGFAEEKLIAVYFQTGDQGSYVKARQHGYVPFLRRDMLAVLESEAGREAQAVSDIIANYAHHLDGIERQVQAYQEVSVAEKWSSRAWQGFYLRLQDEMGRGNWRRVPQKDGGFMAFVWHVRKEDEAKQYLLLQEGKLCFKFESTDKATRLSRAREWSKRILKAAGEQGLDAHRPRRLASGKSMTVAIVDNYRVADESGRIDVAATVERLQAAERVLDAAREVA